ncbi:malonyl-ACP O-methyltransferase, partial [Campylobacter jejuni]|nr:malonyl-ACP O-methyltransferase [Campylobacter jejuni]EIK4806723.1 malonyl-ACP O-methyltransferase [Campylobacter jejuni]HEF2680053.1 malonyl-ACP O-methyltransferase [Campylobacter jejuni]
ISHFEKVFEFGCGRGELSKKLQNFITFDEYLKNDILDFKENSNILIFDMNEISKQDLSKEKFDLIVSNATLQWLDLKQIIPSLRDMLNQNGILLLSTFAKQNLKEIKQSTGFGLNYFSLNELEQIFKIYFNEVKITQELVELSFDNALDVFRHLKLSGVNSLGFYPLNKGFLKEFEEKFQNKLTYHPVFILCKNDIK